MSIDPLKALRARMKQGPATGTSGGGASALESGPRSSPTPSSKSVPAQALWDSRLPLSIRPEQLVPLGSVPCIRYVPDVLAPADAEALLTAIDSPESEWTQLRTRRLQNVGGIVSTEGLTDQSTLPRYLQHLATQLVEAGIFPPDKCPNHALINDYGDSAGIMPHTDGPAYFPLVAIISLNSSAVMNFRKRGTGSQPIAFEVVLQPRSLILFSESAYSEYLHGIPDTCEDMIGGEDGEIPVINTSLAGVGIGDILPRTRRISLTLRYVPPAPSKEKDKLTE